MAKKNLNRAPAGVLNTWDDSHVRKVTPLAIKSKELAQMRSEESTRQRAMEKQTKAMRHQSKVKAI